jgi:hypothetical protein
MFALLPRPPTKKTTIEHVYHALINRKRKEFQKPPTMLVVSKNWQNQSSLQYFLFPQKIPKLFIFKWLKFIKRKKIVPELPRRNKLSLLKVYWLTSLGD